MFEKSIHHISSRVESALHRYRRKLGLDSPGSLWQNQDFLNLWIAETISQFGSQISIVAIPLLAVVMLHATPFEMGLLATVGSLPYLLIGLVAGVWVDRLPKRPLMIAPDIGRGIFLLVIPIAAALDLLTFWLLLVVAFAVGVLSVFFNAAYSALLPRVVRRHQLTDANGKLLGSASVAQIAGPALGGVFVAWFSAPLTMLINAATFFGSGFFIGRVRSEGAANTAEGIDTSVDGTRDRHLGREIRVGVHALVSSPILRSITASTAMNNLAGYIFLSVYVLYMKDDLHLSDSGVGLVYAAGGVCALIGSVLASPFTLRFGAGRTIVWSSVAFGVGGVTVPLAILAPNHALPLVVFAEFAQWLALLIFNTNRIALRQALTPDRLQGRVAASSQVLTGGMQPIGSFPGGVIGSVWSVQTALLVGVFGMFWAFLFVWFSPTRELQTPPLEPDESLLAMA
ncbi:MAG: MFS transporter [Thermomicrobiales bacterium]